MVSMQESSRRAPAPEGWTQAAATLAPLRSESRPSKRLGASSSVTRAQRGDV